MIIMECGYYRLQLRKKPNKRAVHLIWLHARNVGHGRRYSLSIILMIIIQSIYHPLDEAGGDDAIVCPITISRVYLPPPHYVTNVGLIIPKL